MRATITTLCLFISFLSLSVQAQNKTIYELDSLYPVHDLKPFLQILPDQGYEVQELIKDSSLTFLSRSTFPRNLDITTTFWGKISLRSKTELQNWELHFEDPRRRDIAWIRSNGKVDVYAVSEGQVMFHKKTGVDYPKAEREFADNWILNRVRLDIPANLPVTLYIKVENNSFGWFPYINPTLRKPGFTDYHPLFPFSPSFNIFMFGVTFIIFLYHFLQFLYLRQRIFFWFSLWMFLCTSTQAMTIGLDAEYLLGNYPQFRFALWLLIPNSMLFTFWFFGREFINSRTKFPKLDKLMLVPPVVMIFAIISGLILLITGSKPILNAISSYHFIFIILYSALGLIIAVILAFKKDNFARYFGIGAILATCSTLLGGLWSSFIIRVPFDPYIWGMFLQTIAYSFGIAYRQQQLSLKAQKQKLAAKESENEMNRIKDLDEVKTRFFTNLSHEFRTPLTLILGPLNKVETDTANSNSPVVLENKTVTLIKKNALRLQNLVDQLLDLSKLESGKLHLQLTQEGLIAFIRTMVFSFESMAERKNISLNTSFPSEIPGAWYDKDKLEKILSNLLSNALKYTPSGGSVSVIVLDNGGELSIDVIDTGAGIDKGEVHKIFERFYRVEGTEEKGSGIGLALTKELVDLYNGQIRVSSHKGQGTSFKLRLPYSLDLLPKSVETPAEMIIPEPNESEQSSPSVFNNKEQNVQGTLPPTDKPMALVIEDNVDLRDYISDILKDQYTLLTAKDGLQGERMAFEHIPDIIISDVMMPKKDGYEVCHSIKTNIKTSHIPIIMLTAKVGHTNKMEGLTQGADAYLTKPFDEQELLLRMKNLIDARKKIWEHLKSSDLLVLQDLEVSSVDDTFLQKVVSTIKENIDNELLSVEDLGRAVGFSRSQLHRKLKALLNKSANQLIVEIRLNEARRMLEHKAGSVSEIAYSVGYSNMSYFTKSFKEKYGVLPSKV